MLNYYMHWEKLLIRQPGEPPVTILIREGVNQGYPILVILYVITIVSLAEKLWTMYPGRLSPFYADDAAFDESERRSLQILKKLMERGLERGYFPNPVKSLFILDILG